VTQPGPPGNQSWDPQQQGGGTPPPPPPFPAPGQPPAFGGQQPPAFGGQQPPAFGGQQPPAFGQPAFGQPPVPPKKSSNGAIIAIVAAVVVAALAVGGFFLFRGSDDKDKAQPFTADGATKVSQRYIDDIKSGDKKDARTLLCVAAIPGFDRNVESDSSDFLVTIDSSKHVKTTKDGDSYSVQIDATGHERADKTNTFDVRFTFEIVNENGPKICDETVDSN